MPETRDFHRQYSSLYFSRFMTMRKALITGIQRMWEPDTGPGWWCGCFIHRCSSLVRPSRNLSLAGTPNLVQSILDLSPDMPDCILMGTVYKDMKLKPNILDEYHAREVRRRRSHPHPPPLLSRLALPPG